MLDFTVVEFDDAGVAVFFDCAPGFDACATADIEPDNNKPLAKNIDAMRISMTTS
jgi:hypothetical protein